MLLLLGLCAEFRGRGGIKPYKWESGVLGQKLPLSCWYLEAKPQVGASIM